MNKVLEKPIQISKKKYEDIVRNAWKRELPTKEEDIKCIVWKFINADGFGAINYLFRVSKLHELEKLQKREKPKRGRDSKPSIAYAERSIYREILTNLENGLSFVNIVREAGANETDCQSMRLSLQLTISKFKQFEQSFSLKPEKVTTDIFETDQQSPGQPQYPDAINLARAWIFLAVSCALPNETDLKCFEACEKLITESGNSKSLSCGTSKFSFRDSYKIFSKKIVGEFNPGFLLTKEDILNPSNFIKDIYSKLNLTNEEIALILKLYLSHERMEVSELELSESGWWAVEDIADFFSDVELKSTTPSAERKTPVLQGKENRLGRENSELRRKNKKLKDLITLMRK